MEGCKKYLHWCGFKFDGRFSGGWCRCWQYGHGIRPNGSGSCRCCHAVRTAGHTASNRTVPSDARGKGVQLHAWRNRLDSHGITRHHQAILRYIRSGRQAKAEADRGLAETGGESIQGIRQAVWIHRQRVQSRLDENGRTESESEPSTADQQI